MSSTEVEEAVKRLYSHLAKVRLDDCQQVTQAEAKALTFHCCKLAKALRFAEDPWCDITAAAAAGGAGREDPSSAVSSSERTGDATAAAELLAIALLFLMEVSPEGVLQRLLREEGGSNTHLVAQLAGAFQRLYATAAIAAATPEEAVQAVQAAVGDGVGGAYPDMPAHPYQPLATPAAAAASPAPAPAAADAASVQDGLLGQLFAALASLLDCMYGLSSIDLLMLAADEGGTWWDNPRLTCSVTLSLAKVLNAVADRVPCVPLTLTEARASTLLAQMCGILRKQVGRCVLPHSVSIPLVEALLRFMTKIHASLCPALVAAGLPDPRLGTATVTVDEENPGAVCLDVPTFTWELRGSKWAGNSSRFESGGATGPGGGAGAAASNSSRGRGEGSRTGSTSSPDGEREEGEEKEKEEAVPSGIAWAYEACRGLRMLANLALEGAVKDLVAGTVDWGKRRGPIADKEEHFRLFGPALASACKWGRWLVGSAPSMDAELALSRRLGTLVMLCRLAQAALAPAVHDMQMGVKPDQGLSLTTFISTWGGFMFMLIPTVVDVYALLHDHPSMQQGTAGIAGIAGSSGPLTPVVPGPPMDRGIQGRCLLWHLLENCEKAGLQDLLVRAGGGRLLRFWLEDMLASPSCQEFLGNAYIQKSLWRITKDSLGLSLALLKDGEPPLGAAWQVVCAACHTLDGYDAAQVSFCAALEALMGRHVRHGSATEAAHAMGTHAWWQDVKDSLVGPMEKVAHREWARQEGLDEYGQPLPGVVPLNLLYRVAASAWSCCNPGCLNVRGSSELEVQCSKCGGCGKASFCSRRCQKAHWQRHKPACKELRQLG